MTFKQTMNEMKLNLKKNAPAILTGVGIVGVGATAYLAYKHGPAVEEIINEARELKEEGLEVDKKAVALDIAKELTPPVASGLASIGCFIWSYNIQAARISTLSMAFTAVTKELGHVKDRYRETHGDKAYSEFFSPTETYKVTKVDSKGKEKEVDEQKKKEDSFYRGLMSGVWFDGSSEYVVDDHDYNLAWVESQIAKLDLIIFQKGHMLVNEALEMLGYERCRQGALLGWAVTGGFKTSVQHMWNEDRQIQEPQIYITWDTPTYIYEDVEFSGRYGI